MNIQEMIRIEGTPFPNPLSLPSSEYISILKENGFNFEDMGSNRIIILNEVFDPDRLRRVEGVVEAEGWDVKVTRSVWPIFNDLDYQRAPLWVLNFSEIWIDSIDFVSICSECDRKRININKDVQVLSVNSKKPLLNVNGQFKIVNAEAQAVIADSLTGAVFHPFDLKGHYFYLESDTNIGQLVVHEEEMVDFNGYCSQCGRPKFSIYYGPLRYAGSPWDGEDIVFEAFHNGNLFTPKAYELLKKIDKNIQRDGIALLD